MRILVISDIHANLPAFEAVLEDAQGQWDKIWCLGDVIGYGPHPNECVALLREHEHLSLTGNHDWAVLDKLDISEFNPEAQTVVRWTRTALEDEARDYLLEQPAKQVVEPYTLAHASPRYPVWEYITDYDTAVANMQAFDTPICLVGHTHVPVLFIERAPGDVIAIRPDYDETLLLEGAHVIINPGSVGQPRDGDPRAAYALLETSEMAWEFRRVAYPVAATQDAMREVGLPLPLIKRLEYGW